MTTQASDFSVLLVEDELIVALDVELMVQAAGLRVGGHAVRGAEARRLFEAIRPDLCLVDIHLLDGPVGLECGRSFAAAGSAVVFMTANSGSLPCDLAGALGVIEKPYSSDGLLSAFVYLREVLSGQDSAGPAPGALTLAPRNAPQTLNGQPRVGRMRPPREAPRYDFQSPPEPTKGDECRDTTSTYMTD